MVWGGKEVQDALVSGGSGRYRLACLSRRSSKQGGRPYPLWGYQLLPIRLDLKESDRRLQSNNYLKDLVQISRPHTWCLLPPFDFQELLLLSSISSSSFHAVLIDRVMLPQIRSIGFVCTLLSGLFVTLILLGLPALLENITAKGRRRTSWHLSSCVSPAGGSLDIGGIPTLYPPEASWLMTGSVCEA